MSAIFISHSSHDAAVAAEVAQWLKSEGHRSLFLDFDPEMGIPAGRDWALEIYQQIKSCRAVVALCSCHSLRSKWCFAEITQARSLGKAVLPVTLDDCDIDRLILDRQAVAMSRRRQETFAALSRGLMAAGVDPADIFEWDGTRPPYPGLVSFQEDDAAVFFGRDEEVSAGLDLLNRVRRLRSAGFVTVLGSSGSGKSSLVRAGLVPRLRRDPERWLVVDPFRPRDDPIRELAAVFVAGFAAVGDRRARSDIERQLASGLGTRPSDNAVVTLSNELRIAARRSDPCVLIVVDQFEELLGLSPDHEATSLLALLRSALELPRSPLVVLATLRADFLGAFQNSAPLLDLQCESLPVGPMSHADVAAVIEGPARVAGIELQAGLVEAIAADARSGDALPLLAFALRELYEHGASDGALDLVEYRDHLGGLQGALARAADEVVGCSHMSDADTDALRRTFLRLVRLTEDEQWVRRVAAWDDVPLSVWPILERFVEARLLVASTDGTTRTIEVAHEALFRSWSLLVKWIHDDVETLRLQRDLRRAAEQWQESGRDAGELWRGTRLARAKDLVDGDERSVDDLGVQFVAESRRVEVAEQQREAARRRRRTQIAVSVAVVTSALAVIAGLFVIRATRESERADQRTRQIEAIALATTARSLANENPALALALAAESSALTPAPSSQARDALVRGRTAFSARAAQQIGPPLAIHGEDVLDARFSPNGDAVVSVGQDGLMRQWDVDSGAPMGEPVAFHESPVDFAAIGTGSRTIAFLDARRRLQLWDVATHDTIGTPLAVDLTADEDFVQLSRNGDVMALFEADGVVSAWYTATGERVGQPLTVSEEVLLHGLSPDGTLVVGELDGSVSSWELASGRRLATLEQNDDQESFVGFGADGQSLAFVGGDGAVRLFDPRTGAGLSDLAIIDPDWSPIEFSPDGTRVAVLGEDGVHLWHSDGGGEFGPPLTYDALTLSVTFSPDGTHLLTFGDDYTVHLWAVSPGPVLWRGPHIDSTGALIVSATPDETDPGPEGEAVAVAFDARGATLATTTRDGMLSLRNPTTGATTRQFSMGSELGVTAIAFSPQLDGPLAVAGANGSVTLWDTERQTRLGDPLIAKPSVPVTAVAFNPAGTVLAAAGWNGMVHLWDPVTHHEIGEPLTGNAPTASSSISFAPDGRTLAVPGANNSVILWDPDTGTQRGEALRGHDQTVYAVAISPDGDRLASGGEDGSIRLWDLSTSDLVRPPMRLDGSIVYGLAFSPDGAVLASADVSGAHLWDAASGDPLGDHLGSNGGTLESIAFNPDGSVVAFAGGNLQLLPWVWSEESACDLAAPYVTAEQVATYLPNGRRRQTCDLRQ